MRRIIGKQQKSDNDISGTMSALQLGETDDAIKSSVSTNSVTVEDYIAKNGRPSLSKTSALRFQTLVGTTLVAKTAENRWKNSWSGRKRIRM